MSINNNLILRVLNSPWANDIKTPVDLSKTDKFYPIYKSFDNNFIYLKGETIKTGTTKDNKLILNKVNGEDIEVELGSSSDPVTGPELKNYAGHVVAAGNHGGAINEILRDSTIDSRTRGLIASPMPPGYAGGIIENYQLFEMDQYLKATPEENDSGDLLFLEKLDPQAKFGPDSDYAFDNLFEIHNVDNSLAIGQKQGLTAGMDISFNVNGNLSKFRIEAIFQEGNNIYIALLHFIKFDLVNLNKGGLTSEWSRDPNYSIQNDLTLVPGETTSSFYLSEVRVLNYVNTLSLETVPDTETIDSSSSKQWGFGVYLNHIQIPVVVPVQSRDYSNLRTHMSKTNPNTQIDRPFFDYAASDYTVQLWLIREPEFINYYKGWGSRAIIPAIVETDYDVLFNKIKSSYVVKK